MGQEEGIADAGPVHVGDRRGARERSLLSAKLMCTRFIHRILEHGNGGFVCADGQKKMVGAIGFEPTTCRTRNGRSTKLSHAPTYNELV